MRFEDSVMTDGEAAIRKIKSKIGGRRNLKYFLFIRKSIAL